MFSTHFQNFGQKLLYMATVWHEYSNGGQSGTGTGFSPSN